MDLARTEAFMLQRPFRFLHAGDLHLDSPCQTAADLPDHLLDLVIDAPLQAATKVFDAALDQRVDFLLFAGDVVDPYRAAPHELLFLVQQFQRLADRNIPVYWSGGSIDSVSQWPSYIAWPNNVYRFAAGHVQRHRHEIAGAPVCEIIGCSQDPSQPLRPYDFSPSSADLFSIAVAHANWNASALGEIGVNYWALGGQHNRATPLDSKSVAHFAGGTQGRGLNEPGLRGCTLVTVDEVSRPRLSSISCDVLRWLTLQVSLPAAAKPDDLQRMLLERIEQLQTEAAGVPLFVAWQVACTGALRFALEHESLANELIAKLCESFGHQATLVWTLSIAAAKSDSLPVPWLTEETIRGDFLRAAQQCAVGVVPHSDANVPESMPLVFPSPESLSELLSTDGQSIPSDLRDSLAVATLSPEARRELLDEVAWLGADLLSPVEAQR
jgi:DNA repair protein SbcD/Mre11